MWTTTAQAIAELRQLMNDGAQDKLRYRQKVIGIQNGTNTTFKSLEFRRVTSLVGATSPVGVFVNGSAVSVVSDDLPSGEFNLGSAPNEGDDLRITYYLQWFTDAELTEFLTTGTEQIIPGGVDPALVVSAFQPSVLKYAAGEGYLKLSIKWSENISYVYMLDDAPQEKRFDPVKQYADLAKTMKADAINMRNDIYARQGQALAPRFATLRGRVRDVKPNR